MRSRIIGLGILGIVCSQIPHDGIDAIHPSSLTTVQQAETSLPPKLISYWGDQRRVLPYASLGEARAALQQNARNKGEEQVYISDGTLFIDAGMGNATKHSQQIDLPTVLDFIAHSPGDTLYFEHSHGPYSFQGKELVNPPSRTDLLLHFLLKREANTTGKQFHSLVVDPYGKWSYTTPERSDIPPLASFTGFAMLQQQYFPVEIKDLTDEALARTADQPQFRQVRLLGKVFAHFGCSLAYEEMR